MLCFARFILRYPHRPIKIDVHGQTCFSSFQMLSYGVYSPPAMQTRRRLMTMVGALTWKMITVPQAKVLIDSLHDLIS